MSQANVDRVTEGIEAFNQRDMEGLLAVLHPDIEWDSGMPGTSPYGGRDGVRTMLQGVETAWKDLKMTPIELTGRGDIVLAVCKLTAHGRTSGVAVEGDQIGVIDFADGFLHRVRIFTSRAEALEAAGLSE